jgi:hypothetical protein
MKVLNTSIALLLSGSSAAFADVGIATISDVSGKVLVNSGKGFVPAAADMVLKAGDRVFVGEQSFATLSYEECAALLDKPAVVTVTSEVGCNVATSIHPVLTRGRNKPPNTRVSKPLPNTFTSNVVFTSAAVLGMTCAVGCEKLFGDKENGISGQ